MSPLTTDMSPTVTLVAISGPSCSGKTTLSRLLRDALQPHAFILHEDDFYVTDAEIPIVTTKDGRKIQDWDCLESLDLKGLEEMLRHIKSTGRIKDGFDSKEDQNDVGKVEVDDEEMTRSRESLKTLISGWKEGEHKIAIIDGFLLFSERMKSIIELFDARLLLTTDYDTMKRRREARKGYVTLEGFWQDPPGYVDDVVWPNYVKDHEFLCVDGNINNDIDDAKCSSLGISSMPVAARQDMTKCFTWAVDILEETLGS